METCKEVALLCNCCRESKPISEFRRRPDRSEKGKRMGRWSYCHDCEKARMKTPHARALANARTKEFRQRLLTSDPAEARRRERASNLKRNYGLTIEQYDAMVAWQDGKCAICGGPPSDPRWKGHASPVGGRRIEKFHIDHNHKTGDVRALLCSQCNRGLGDFRDDPALLLKAAEYLTVYQ